MPTDDDDDCDLLRDLSLSICDSSKDDETSDDDKTYLHLENGTRLGKFIKEGYDEIHNNISGKDVVVIIGTTGAGKSTFIHLLNGEKFEQVDGSHHKYRSIGNNRATEDFKIGLGSASCTQRPYVYEYKRQRNHEVTFEAKGSKEDQLSTFSGYDSKEKEEIVIEEDHSSKISETKDDQTDESQKIERKNNCENDSILFRGYAWI